MTIKPYITVHVATDLLADLREWSPPVQVQLIETPDQGTGYELVFRTVTDGAPHDSQPHGIGLDERCADCSHGVSINEDEDGWILIVCDCGWGSPPCPSLEIALDSWGDHRIINFQAELEAIKASR